MLLSKDTIWRRGQYRTGASQITSIRFRWQRYRSLWLPLLCCLHQEPHLFRLCCFARYLLKNFTDGRILLLACWHGGSAFYRLQESHFRSKSTWRTTDLLSTNTTAYSRAGSTAFWTQSHYCCGGDSKPLSTVLMGRSQTHGRTHG